MGHTHLDRESDRGTRWDTRTWIGSLIEVPDGLSDTRTWIGSLIDVPDGSDTRTWIGSLIEVPDGLRKQCTSESRDGFL